MTSYFAQGYGNCHNFEVRTPNPPKKTKYNQFQEAWSNITKKSFPESIF